MSDLHYPLCATWPIEFIRMLRNASSELAGAEVTASKKLIAQRTFRSLLANIALR
jgi:hypothetical protein